MPMPITVATQMVTSNRATIFGYEKDASMAGLIAPARRAGFFFSDYSADHYAKAKPGHSLRLLLLGQ